MSTQIAFRLSDEEVATLDELVSSGLATDRTAAMRRALASERRRLTAERDARIYAATEPDDDMQSLARWASSRPLDID